jgi:hypothetical protein
MRRFFSNTRKSFTQACFDAPASVGLMSRLSRCDSFFTLDFIFFILNQLLANSAQFLGRTMKSLNSWASGVGTMEMFTDLSTDLVDRLNKR